MTMASPAGWKAKRLKYAVWLRRERVVGANDDRPFIGLEHIESGTGRLATTGGTDLRLGETEAHSGESMCNSFEHGDVLFGKLRPYLAKTWVAEFPGRCSTELLVMRPVEVEPRFLRDICLTRAFVDAVDASTFGSKMPRAEWDFIGDMKILYPPVLCQRAIADYLDRETARIDALVAAKERLLGVLAEKRRALISHAVTKGLDPNVRMRDSGVEWLGKVPEHWRPVSLKHFSDIHYGLGQPPRYSEDGIPFVRATNIKRGHIVSKGLVFIDEADLPDSRIVRLRQGDIVVVRSGAYTGDSAIVTLEWEDSIAGYDMVIRVRRLARPAFVSFVMLCQYVLEAQVEPFRLRAAQPHLNAEELGEVELLLPPLGEQDDIIAHIETETARLDAVRAAAEKTIVLLKERRAVLISAAVTGKVDVAARPDSR